MIKDLGYIMSKILPSTPGIENYEYCPVNINLANKYLLTREMLEILILMQIKILYGAPTVNYAKFHKISYQLIFDKKY